MRLFPTLVALALIACSGGAEAAPPAAGATGAVPATVAGTGWQYARWGMSPAEVVAASSGQAVLSGQNSRTNTVFGSTGAEARYSQPPFTFRVFFNFRYGKLTQVTLHPDPKAECTPLVNELTRRFGPPQVKSLYTGITTFYWPDTAIANDIRLFRVPDTCSISYVQHGLVPARAPQGRARFDSLNPGPRQDVEKARKNPSN